MTLIALTASLASLLPFQGAVVDPNYGTLQSAVAGLASPTLFLQLNGSINYKNKTTPLVSNLSWSTSLDGTTVTYQVDLESWVNGVLVKRVVGDGNTLWSYDLSVHQYSATPYGGTPGYARPDTYLGDLLNDVNWAASGSDAYLTKLLRQVFSSSTPTYTSWMPGVTSVMLQQDYPVYDPVNSAVTYFPTPTDNFYVYNNAPKRSIAFEVAAGLTSNQNSQPVSGLQNIYFNQVEVIARNERLTQWTITPYLGLTFSADIFKPYTGKQIQGWRPIVAPKQSQSN